MKEWSDFQIGDLVDVHKAVKGTNTGLAVIVDSEHEDADEDKKEVKQIWRRFLVCFIKVSFCFLHNH